ncbi:MAG: polyprenyl synthetase family protein [Planctomycetes bacterium]|nr:polyprenyl synthetase family protein [Planctomycetota bacterium]
MASYEPASQESAERDIKQVPADAKLREAVRHLAAESGKAMDRSRPFTRENIERRAQRILGQLSLSDSFLGFAMVAVSNVFWRHQFEAVPFDRRLLLMPNCLRDKSSCKGVFDHVGLHCAGCGACTIGGVKSKADELGYQVIVAEGTPAVIMKIMEGEADAIMGVACLDSLEKAFKHVVELGTPHVAVPLLNNGCADTTVEVDRIMRFLQARRSGATERTHTYVPLLRETVRIFDRPAILALMSSCMQADLDNENVDPMNATESIAFDWLLTGGKRLRPFVTIAAYAVGKHGTAPLAPDTEVSGLIPDSVKRIGLAIEALHKASLVHDDIEDDDAFRYGRQTLHRRHGIGPALNVGDLLVGLGYRLISGESAALGAQCVADILCHLSSAHLELCRGQGAELLWQKRHKKLRPIDALSIYALKTAPAFETALFAGLRAAGLEIENGALRRFSTCLGEGYQVLNDLADWREDDRNKVTLGQDVVARRPTILRAFAEEAGGEERLAELSRAHADDMTMAAAVKALYTELGVFAKAEKLLEKLTSRANDVAGEIEQPALSNLLKFLVKIVL